MSYVVPMVGASGVATTTGWPGYRRAGLGGLVDLVIDANPGLSPSQLELLRGLERRRGLKPVWDRVDSAVSAFAAGEPVSVPEVLRLVTDSHTAIVLLSQMLTELGGAIAANPGTIGGQADGLGRISPRRTWP